MPIEDDDNHNNDNENDDNEKDTKFELTGGQIFLIVLACILFASILFCLCILPRPFNKCFSICSCFNIRKVYYHGIARIMNTYFILLPPALISEHNFKQKFQHVFKPDIAL